MERAFSAGEARANFSQLVTEAGYAGREVVIEGNSRPVAVIIAYEQCLELRRQASERASCFAICDAIRSRNPKAHPEPVEADASAAGGLLGGLAYYGIQTAHNPCAEWNWGEALFWSGAGTVIVACALEAHADCIVTGDPVWSVLGLRATRGCGTCCGLLDGVDDHSGGLQ